jgi:hypothetical protein
LLCSQEGTFIVIIIVVATAKGKGKIAWPLHRDHS